MEQEWLQLGWVDEASSCSAERIKELYPLLRKEYRVDALCCAIRHNNQPVIQFFLDQSMTYIRATFLYAVQLNKEKVIRFLYQGDLAHQTHYVDDLINGCIGKLFDHQNMALITELAEAYKLTPEMVHDICKHRVDFFKMVHRSALSPFY